MDAVFPAATVGAKLLMNALEYGKHTANHWTQDTNSYGINMMTLQGQDTNSCTEYQDEALSS